MLSEREEQIDGCTDGVPVTEEQQQAIGSRFKRILSGFQDLIIDEYRMHGGK